MKPQDNSANIKNDNTGTAGTNRQYDQNQGNRGKQLNPTPNDANIGRKAAPAKPTPSAPARSARRNAT